MGPMPNHVSAYCGTWRLLPEGMSQMFRLLYLGNGWADCVEIWHALGDPLVTAYTIVNGWGISARAHVQRYPNPLLQSRKRLGLLCSNLVCGLGVVN